MYVPLEGAAIMVDRDFAGGRWTKSQYRSFIVGALRKASMRYPVKVDVKNAARRPNQSENKRMRWEYQCSRCLEWFRGDEVQVDNSGPVWDILEDPGGYLGGMFCEADNLRVLCKGCHQVTTNQGKK